MKESHLILLLSQNEEHLRWAKRKSIRVTYALYRLESNYVRSNEFLDAFDLITPKPEGIINRANRVYKLLLKISPMAELRKHYLHFKTYGVAYNSFYRSSGETIVNEFLNDNETVESDSLFPLYKIFMNSFNVSTLKFFNIIVFKGFKFSTNQLIALIEVSTCKYTR